MPAACLIHASDEIHRVLQPPEGPVGDCEVLSEAEQYPCSLLWFTFIDKALLRMPQLGRPDDCLGWSHFVPGHLFSKLNLLGNDFATAGKGTKKKYSPAAHQAAAGVQKQKIYLNCYCFLTGSKRCWLRNLTLVPPG